MAAMVYLNAFFSSNFFGQLVCIFLLGSSVFFLALIVPRFCFFAQCKWKSIAFLKRYGEYSHPISLYVSANFGEKFRDESHPFVSVYLTASEALRSCLNAIGISDEDMMTWKKGVHFGPALTPAALSMIRARTEAEMQTKILDLEKYLSFFSSCANIAPSIGLLGTVDGIMRAFWSMYTSNTSNALVQTVAPGISSALLTTVIGLIVSIPASIAFNFLVEKIRNQSTALENFTDNLLSDIERFHSSATPQQPTAAVQPIVIQTQPAYAAQPVYPAQPAYGTPAGSEPLTLSEPPPPPDRRLFY